jgi:hypothetical protein
MATQKQMEQGQDSESKNQSLDRRYGKIGIAAVAGAMRPNMGRKPDKRETNEQRRFHYESD